MDVDIFFASAEVFRVLTGLQILLKIVMDMFEMICFNEDDAGSRIACSERGLYFIMSVDIRSCIFLTVVWGSAEQETESSIRRGYRRRYSTPSAREYIDRNGEKSSTAEMMIERK